MGRRTSLHADEARAGRCLLPCPQGPSPPVRPPEQEEGLPKFKPATEQGVELEASKTLLLIPNGTARGPAEGLDPPPACTHGGPRDRHLLGALRGWRTQEA